MRNIALLFVLLTVMAVSCTPKVKNEPVDLKSIESRISQLADQYVEASNNRDYTLLETMIADEGLFCGTDPDELMGKEELFKAWEYMSADTTADYHYKVDKREILVTPDGQSAIVMEYITAGVWSPVLKIRQTSHFVRYGADWKINFMEWGFMIPNKHVSLVNGVSLSE
jgi:ketosteroid isomerase-like protein